MSEKTLVEQLREFIKEQIGTGFYLANELTKFADRIEAEYMPYPLDADGVSVKPGDPMEYDGIKFVAETFVWRQSKDGITSFGSGHCLIGDGGYKADHCHHVEPPKPLTKDDIDALAKADMRSFWNCRGSSCSNCPAKIDGKTPYKYYDTRSSCTEAIPQHILRLERERVAGEQA